jgi:betaine reductase
MACEENGLPTVVVSALCPLVKSVGANRIVEGRAVMHMFGDPELPPEDELNYRRKVVSTALEALQTEVSKPTIFYV